ncbi:MAG TPA: tRNA lysidine(34) synthetase TilS [Chthoniobacteraceae bacterium]|jgi:tRNA(Ile)-lysidine synthase
MGQRHKPLAAFSQQSESGVALRFPPHSKTSFVARLQLPHGEPTPALIGVSGGRDSIALLHLLVEAGWKQLVVCHLDHGLRVESAEDARFVAKLADRFALPHVCKRLNVRTLAARNKQSLETAAREARYAFFARTARSRRCPRLFLAHHADDQVETFLFNLFRGTGAGGLKGMRPVSRRTIDGTALEIIRPLLGVWREEVDAFVSARGLEFREDASNADPQFTRNRLRHELLPLLEKGFGREVRRAVWRAAEILGAEDELLTSLLPGHGEEGESRELEVDCLRLLPVALQRRKIYAWLRGNGVARVGYEAVEAVRALLTDHRRAKINLPGGIHARRRAGKLFLEAS